MQERHEQQPDGYQTYLDQEHEVHCAQCKRLRPQEVNRCRSYGPHLQASLEGEEDHQTHLVVAVGVGPHPLTIQEAAEALILLQEELEVEALAKALVAMAADHRPLPS